VSRAPHDKTPANPACAASIAASAPGATAAAPRRPRAARHLTPRAPARQALADNPNACKQLHMPAQSGSTSVLARMRRGYTRGAYDALLRRVRESLPQARPLGRARLLACALPPRGRPWWRAASERTGGPALHATRGFPLPSRASS